MRAIRAILQAIHCVHVGAQGIQRLPDLVRWPVLARCPSLSPYPHGHPGGEEILVLEGVFQDEQGTYPAGTWLRNPPGSCHHPWSVVGCTIWVKTGHLPATRGPDDGKGDLALK